MLSRDMLSRDMLSRDVLSRDMLSRGMLSRDTFPSVSGNLKIKTGVFKLLYVKYNYNRFASGAGVL